MEKKYLGDGVYIQIQNGQFVLTTENGLDATNTIYLEPEVAKEMVNYVNGILKGA